MKRTQLYAEKAIWEVARQNGTTVDEVKNEIELAILAGLSDPDPAVQAKWKAIPSAGGTPTPEELIDYMVNKLPR